MSRDANDILREEGPDAMRHKIDAAILDPKEAASDPSFDEFKRMWDQVPPPEDEPPFDIHDTLNRGKSIGKKKRQENVREDWRNDLIVTPTNAPKSLVANALTALSQAPEWRGVLAYDEFALVTKQTRPPPWLQRQDNSWTPRNWEDRDDTLTADWLQHQGINVKTSVAAEAVETVAKDASFHPIKEYLTGLEWDGKKRIENFASGISSRQSRIMLRSVAVYSQRRSCHATGLQGRLCADLRGPAGQRQIDSDRAVVLTMVL